MNLDRIIIILETISNSGRPISTTEIHKLTGIPKPTCYRTAEQLIFHGILDDPNDNGKYLIGERLRTIVMAGTPDKDICLAIGPLLQETAKKFDEAVFLSRFRNSGVEIIHVETPKNMTSSFVHPGLGFRPLHACSCSKAILAFSEDSFKQKILNGPKKQYTANTKISKTELEQELKKIKEKGYAECVEEIQNGIASVAVPIRIKKNETLFSIGTIGPVNTFDDQKRDDLGNQLLKLSHQCSHILELNIA
jgi:IclR family acetate operon transcriptional repressor